MRFQGSPLGPRDTLNWVFVPCTAQVMGRGLGERVPAWLLAAGWAGGLSRPIELRTCERWALTAPPALDLLKIAASLGFTCAAVTSRAQSSLHSSKPLPPQKA